MSQVLPILKGDAIDRILQGANVPVMFVFGAPWSAACRRQMADARTLANQMAGRAEVYLVDIDASRPAASHLGIHSIPTVIIFDRAVERVRFIGVQSIRTLAAALGQRSGTTAFAGLLRPEPAPCPAESRFRPCNQTGPARLQRKCNI